MFNVGEIVVYGSEGVCTIAEEQILKVSGKRTKYYVLRPINRPASTVFVPLENETLVSRMRYVLTREEIDTILAEVQTEEIVWEEDPNLRKSIFTKILTSGDRPSAVRMIRMLYERRTQLREQGRRLRTADEQMLREAEKLVNDEFAYALAIHPTEVPTYIQTHIQEQLSI